VFVPLVDVQVLPPEGVAVNTIDAAVSVPLPVIDAVNAASVGVAAAASASGTANRTPRRTAAPLGRLGLRRGLLTTIAAPGRAR
jgi:hypothetical protein